MENSLDKSIQVSKLQIWGGVCTFYANSMFEHLSDNLEGILYTNRP